MFRNVESHFATIPRAEIERSTFDRPSELKTSFNFADLIPIYAEEILPGDTVRMTTSKVVRMQTLLTPVLDNAYLDVFWFFVPNRLVWTNWKRFMGETVYPDGAWVQQVQYQVPSISAPSGGFAKGTLADYFGLPVGLNWSNTDMFRPMALPFRCYAMIANEFFRDENVSDPLNIPTGDSNQTGTNGSNYINDVANGGMPFKVAKFHDMFTSCLPAPLRASQPVTFPLLNGNNLAPVQARNAYTDPSLTDPSVTGIVTSLTPNAAVSSASFKAMYYTSGNDVMVGANQTFNNAVTASTDHVRPVNLWADLSSNVGSVTVNELRLAFQLQRFYEKSARAGSRYTETIKAFFGVTSPDSRLQRPEYLGGNRVPININEVTNSAQSTGEPLGDLGAKSHTTDVNYDFEHSFTEHGWLIGVMCARTDKTYTQGIDQKWLRKTTFDYYFPTFAHVGEMPIYDVSIYADSTSINNPNVFGYNEAWIEYRAKNNKATGSMRPNGLGDLGDVWTFADHYTSQPVLSDGWIREDKANVDRTLAVQSNVADQLFCDIYFDSTWTRPMPVYSVPGLIDHF